MQPGKLSPTPKELPDRLWLNILKMLFGYDYELSKTSRRFRDLLSHHPSYAQAFLKQTITEKPECLFLDNWPLVVRTILEKNVDPELYSTPKLALQAPISSDEKDEKKLAPIESTPADLIKDEKIHKLVAKCYQRLSKPRQVILDCLKNPAEIKSQRFTDLTKAFFSIAKANAEKLFMELFILLPENIRKQLLKQNDGCTLSDFLAGEIENYRLRNYCPVTYGLINVAAFLGNEILTDFLLKQGASTGAPDSYRHDSKACLETAAMLGHAKVIKVLLIHPGSDDFLNISLSIAIENGHFEAVELLLTAKSKTSSKFAFRDALKLQLRTTLEFTKKNRLELVQLLLQWKESEEFLKPDFSFDDGTTPFLLAAGGGPLELVQMFAAKGVNISATTPTGLNALHMAALGNRFSSDSEQIKVMQWLLESKEDPRLALESKDNSGFTTLFMAVGKKSAAAEFLLRHNANIQGTVQKDGRHLDILSLAVFRGRSTGESFLPFLDFLLAELKIRRDFDFQTSLDKALWEALGLHLRYTVLGPNCLLTRKIIDRLLAAGANPHFQNEQQQTPFEAAINSYEDYHAIIAAAFIKHVAIKSKEQANQYLLLVCRNVKKYINLHHISTAESEIIKMLLENGADMIVREKLHLQHTLEQIACKSPQALETMVRFLQRESQCSIIKDMLINPAEKSDTFQPSSIILIEALRAFPLAGKKYLRMVLDHKETVEKIHPGYYFVNFPKFDAALISFKKTAKHIKTFQTKTLPALIDQELKKPQLSTPVETKFDSSLESKTNTEEIKTTYQRLLDLWNCNPKNPTEGAEKNVIFALLVEYLQNKHGLDEKTGIDAFDIIEMGIEYASRLFGFSEAEYAKPLRALLMTADGKPYLPLKFRWEFIKELQEGLQEFLYGLSKEETKELNALRNRICPIESLPLQNLASPATSITKFLLDGGVAQVTQPASSNTAQNNPPNPNLPGHKI